MVLEHHQSSNEANPVRVTVVIPAYNAGIFIEASVKSALSQTLSDLEVLVVDDRSTDNTRSVVGRLAELDTRVVLLDNIGLQGPSGARNTGLAAARGMWIAILDADDMFEPSRLERLIESAVQRRLDAVSDNISVVDFETRELIETAFTDDMMDRHAPIDIDWMLDHDFPGTHAHRPFGFSKIVISSSFLKRTDVRYMEDISLGEDFLFYAQLILAGCVFGLYAGSLYISSQRTGSLSWRARDFSQLVEANRRVRLSCARSGSGELSYRWLRQIDRRLEKRQDAFLYTEFCTALKEYDLAGSFRSARKLRIGYLVAGLLRASRRRLQAPGVRADA